MTGNIGNGNIPSQQDNRIIGDARNSKGILPKTGDIGIGMWIFLSVISIKSRVDCNIATVPISICIITAFD